ncbi:MAG: DUF2164 family protein [Candidatus Magasanikbacteria bacterium]
MTKIKKQWDIIPKENRKHYIEKIITFFAEQKDEEIGMIAAEEFLDFFLENFAQNIYNKGLEDAKLTLKKRFEDFDLDIDLLKQNN